MGILSLLPPMAVKFGGNSERTQERRVIRAGGGLDEQERSLGGSALVRQGRNAGYFTTRTRRTPSRPARWSSALTGAGWFTSMSV